MEFADHHPYTNGDAQDILARADAQNLAIATTLKDHVRLKGLGDAGDELARKAHIVEIDVVFDDRGFPRLILEQVQRKFSRR
jgi:tetraacyldisaccharide 4'-kinase